MAKPDKTARKEQRFEDFLKELTKLTNKFGVRVSGCGCCGSPFIVDEKAKGEYGIHSGTDGDLTWS